MIVPNFFEKLREGLKISKSKSIGTNFEQIVEGLNTHKSISTETILGI